MSVKANGSPRIYLPQISAHQTNRGALNRKQDLFKPSQGNPFAYSYGREKSRDQLLHQSGLKGNGENFQRNLGYPLPRIAKEPPKKRKTWGKVIDKRSIEEEKPSKRGSWAINETHTSVPKLYNSFGSKVREHSFTSFDNSDEVSSSIENSHSFGDSASGRRRKQWSRPNKNIAQQEIPVSIEEENGYVESNQGIDPYQGTPRIIYDRHGPVTATYEPSFGGPPVPTNHTPSSHRYHRTPRNRRPGQPPSSDSIGALNTGSTRSGEENTSNINNLLERFASEIDEESYLNLNRHNKPNMFGSNYRPFYPSPSNFVVSPPPRAKTKAKPVLTDKRASAPTRPAQQDSSAQSKVPPSVPSASKVVGKPPISGRGVKNERKKIIPADSAETRPAKYTYTIENEADSKNSAKKSTDKSDDRPAKYTFTKEKTFTKDDDEERPSKYTYTIDKDSKTRSVTFKEDNKKNGKNTVLKSNAKTKSKPAPSISTEPPTVAASVKASNTTDQSESLSPGRKNWSPPTGELFDEDPRQFWVDMNSKKEDDSKVAGKQRSGSKTPRKSKRMAAKLDGHSSTEGDITPSNSKSVSESAEVRTPRGKKTEDRPGSVQEKKGTARQPEVEDTKNNTSDESLLQSQDDIPMIQKLKQMNQGSKDQKRKKDVPKWLKQEEENAGPFEKPPSRGGSGQDVATPLPLKDHMTQQKDVDMLIDEELALWPESGKPDLKTVFDTDKKPPVASREVKESDSATPMKKIQQNRAKWRDSQKKNLEESWGSLNMFDRHQKGRISMDLDDDALDEYLQMPSKKATPNQPSIKEEAEEVEPITTSPGGEPDDNFVIPELPYGKELVINIKTTWGDKHYVGLTGVEVFSSTGESMTITKITAKPLDINILNEYDKDPRVVTNLVDGVNRTRDDVHMWLTPFTPKKDHFIYLTFEKPCQVALMRIWNYNKSRIHSYRGAKDVIIQLDSNVIFKGEIARACGGIEGGTEAFGDTILFTTDENILEAVSKNDDAYEGDMLDDSEPDDVPFERPSTADGGSDEDRPFTRAQGNLKKQGETSPVPPRPATSMVTEGDVIVFKGKSLQLNFTDTWGDLHYLGLTGLEVLGKDGEALPVSLDMMQASPSDLHHLPGHESDDRTLDKVINGNNVTCSDENMWLIPFNEGQNHELTITFSQALMMAGLRVWNYNKSPEDTYRGAKTVHVQIDGKQVSPPEGYLIRKGPGNCYFDFAQEIVFAGQQKPPIPPTSETKMDSSVRSSVTDDGEYESVQMPCGFIYQLHLISTWGDPYYVGLNGIEIYDASHNKIELTETNIAAYPDSVNVLANIQNDVRTPDRLIDGVNSTNDGRHMWLAPILPTTLNRVYVIFDQPTAVSMIKIWNYSKTANRGAKDIALLVDDLLVYNGMLQPVRAGAKGIVPNCDTPQSYHTILFTDNKDIIRKEKHSIISNQAGEQDIQLTNDKIVVGQYSDPKKAQQGKPVNQELRPKTSVVAHKYRR